MIISDVYVTYSEHCRRIDDHTPKCIQTYTMSTLYDIHEPYKGENIVLQIATIPSHFRSTKEAQQHGFIKYNPIDRNYIIPSEIKKKEKKAAGGSIIMLFL